MDCPACHQPVSDSARFCRQCGQAIERTAPTAQQIPAARTCPACHKPVSVNAQFCRHCGQALDQPLPQPPARETPASPRHQAAAPRPEQASTTLARAPTTLPSAAGRLRLSVAIPPDMPWHPEVAERLLTTLMAMKAALTLVIRATVKGIVWAIDVPASQQGQVTSALLSLYPQADLSVKPVPEPTPAPFALTVSAWTEFYVPLTYAHDTKNVDPLAAIVGAMGSLEAGEGMAYELALLPSTTNYYKEGFTGMTQSGFNLAMLLIPVGWLLAPFAAAKRVQKYETKYHRLYEEKINAPLVAVQFRIRIQAQASRADALAKGMRAALAVANRNDGNSLIATSLFYDEKRGEYREEGSTKRQPLVFNPYELATLWHLPSRDCQTPGIVWSSGVKAPLPRELLQGTGDLLLGENHFQGVTRPVYLAYPDRVTHINLVGKTRVGKTTLLHNLIHEDIAAGKGVGVIDPHGDLVSAILQSSIPPEREKDVVLFDLADTQYPVGMNLLAVPAGVPSQVAVALTMGVLKKLFAEQWSATRMEDALYSALLALATVPQATIRDLSPLFLDASFRQRVLAQVTDSVALEFWEQDYGRLSERQQLEVARPILHRIRVFYRNPVINAIICQPKSLDIGSMMDSGKIFLASLAGSATQSEAGTIGALLISKIQMAAMSRSTTAREQRRMFYLYIDEVQNFITTSLSTLFSEAAKYGLSMTVANQYLSQLEGGTLESVMGNTGTMILFACGSEDAGDLGRYLKPVFDPQSLMNLDRFQTIVKMQKAGQSLPPFTMQTLPGPDMPADASVRAQRIRSYSQRTYALPALPPQVSEKVSEETHPENGHENGHVPISSRDTIRHAPDERSASDDDPGFEER